MFYVWFVMPPDDVCDMQIRLCLAMMNVTQLLDETLRLQLLFKLLNDVQQARISPPGGHLGKIKILQNLSC
jgi:hypothetical protein